MPKQKKYRCNNCGERFECEVYTEEDLMRAEKNKQKLHGSQIRCPKCNRTDYREGWD